MLAVAPDKFDGKTGCATFSRIADGVLDVTHVVDHSIKCGVSVTADVDGGVELSDLSVERRAD